MRDIGKNIKDLRSRKQMTQDELAEKLFVTRQTVSNYETGKSKPDIDMLVKISEILNTDVQQLIYGIQPTATDLERKRLIIGAAATAAALTVFLLIRPVAAAWQDSYFTSLKLLNHALFFVLTLICAGWTVGQLIGMALRQKPPEYTWIKYARTALAVILVVYLSLILVCFGTAVLNDFLFAHKLRGEWVAHEGTNTLTGETYTSMGYRQLPVPLPQWLLQLVGTCFFALHRHLWVFFLAGTALWLLGFPKSKSAN